MKLNYVHIENYVEMYEVGTEEGIIHVLFNAVTEAKDAAGDSDEVEDDREKQELTPILLFKDLRESLKKLSWERSQHELITDDTKSL